MSKSKHFHFELLNYNSCKNGTLCCSMHDIICSNYIILCSLPVETWRWGRACTELPVASAAAAHCSERRHRIPDPPFGSAATWGQQGQGTSRARWKHWNTESLIARLSLWWAITQDCHLSVLAGAPSATSTVANHSWGCYGDRKVMMLYK